MSPELKAVFRVYLCGWQFWIGCICFLLGAITNFLLAHYGVGPQDSFSNGGFGNVFLLLMLPGAVGWTHLMFLASPTLFLAPEHSRLHRLVAFGVLIPASVVVIWIIECRLSMINPLSALAISLGGVVAMGNAHDNTKTSVLFMLTFMSLFFVWIYTRSFSSWHPSDGVVLALGVLGYWSRWRSAILPVGSPQGALALNWNYFSAMDRLPFLKLPQGLDVLSLVRRLLSAWTPPSYMLMLFATGFVVSCGLHVFCHVTAVPDFNLFVFHVVVIMSLIAPLVMHIDMPVFGGLSLRVRAVDRLRFPSRQLAATVLILTTILRMLVYGLVGLSSVLVAEMGWRFMNNESVVSKIPWYFWLELLLVPCVFGTALALVVTYSRFRDIAILSSAMCLLLILTVPGLEEYGVMPYVLLAYAICAAVMIPLAWRRLANAELP